MEVDLLHEIPVRVMRAADIQYYTPPDVPPPRVQLELPYNRVRFKKKWGGGRGCLCRLVGRSVGLCLGGGASPHSFYLSACVPPPKKRRCAA